MLSTTSHVYVPSISATAFTHLSVIKQPYLHMDKWTINQIKQYTVSLLLVRIIYLAFKRHFIPVQYVPALLQNTQSNSHAAVDSLQAEHLEFLDDGEIIPVYSVSGSILFPDAVWYSFYHKV